MKVASTYGDSASYALLLLGSSTSAVEATSTHMQNLNTKSFTRGSAEERIPVRVYGCTASGKICL